MTNPFWNPKERRFRSLLRVILQIVIMGLLLLGMEFIIAYFTTRGLPGTIEASTPQGFAKLQLLYTLSPVITLLGIAGSVFTAGLWLDHRPFSDFGFHFSWRWWRNLAFGLGLGAVQMLVIFLFELALGWVTITGAFKTADPRLTFGVGLIQSIILYLCVGIYEELFTRGYLLLNLAEGFNFSALGARAAMGIALVLSSIVFGMLHLGNPSATWFSTFNIFIVGIFLATGYVLTGELAIPIGIHITWNFFQGAVFGFPVSGTNTPIHFINIQQGGPLLWTGGPFGPEAGLVGLLAMAAGIAVIFWWTRRNPRQEAILEIRE